MYNTHNFPTHRPKQVGNREEIMIPYDNFTIPKLNLSLDKEKIDLLKGLVFGGFKSYLRFVKQYRPDLFIDTRYQDEITEELDNIMIAVIKGEIKIHDTRVLRPLKVFKALQKGDMEELANIIASAARSCVSFLNVTQKAHFVNYYQNYDDNFEIDFDELKKPKDCDDEGFTTPPQSNEVDYSIIQNITFVKSKKNQVQLALAF